MRWPDSWAEWILIAGCQVAWLFLPLTKVARRQEPCNLATQSIHVQLRRLRRLRRLSLVTIARTAKIQEGGASLQKRPQAVAPQKMVWWVYRRLHLNSSTSHKTVHVNVLQCNTCSPRMVRNMQAGSLNASWVSWPTHHKYTHTSTLPPVTLESLLTCLNQITSIIVCFLCCVRRVMFFLTVSMLWSDFRSKITFFGTTSPPWLAGSSREQGRPLIQKCVYCEV